MHGRSLSISPQLYVIALAAGCKQDRNLQNVIIARVYIYSRPAPPNFVQLRIRTLLTIRTFLLAAKADAVLTLFVEIRTEDYRTSGLK